MLQQTCQRGSLVRLRSGQKTGGNLFRIHLFPLPPSLPPSLSMVWGLLPPLAKVKIQTQFLWLFLRIFETKSLAGGLFFLPLRREGETSLRDSPDVCPSFYRPFLHTNLEISSITSFPPLPRKPQFFEATLAETCRWLGKNLAPVGRVSLYARSQGLFQGITSILDLALVSNPNASNSGAIFLIRSNYRR